jgi:hypothetical protein
MDARDKELEDDDPYELVAVSVTGPPGYDGPAAMARVFIEEFALMGWPPARIMRLFKSPKFAGTNSVYEERGEAYVQGLIDEVFAGRTVEPERERGAGSAERGAAAGRLPAGVSFVPLHVEPRPENAAGSPARSPLPAPHSAMEGGLTHADGA